MQPVSGNQRPDLLTSLMNMSLVLRLPREIYLCRSSSNVPRLPSFLKNLQNPHVLLTPDKVHNPLRLPRETTSERPKMLRTLSVFCTFDLETCFPPQRRALFRHLNCQKWSQHCVFCAFSLGNVLRTTTACTFSTSQLPSGPNIRCFCTFGSENELHATMACTFSTSHFKKSSEPGVFLYILTWKCASRHNGVQFFISHLGSWLRTRRFSEPTFGPSGATNHWKTECFATFLPFRAPGSSFFGDFHFFDLLSSSLLFSDSSHLCFSSVHIVGSLTSKLPSTTICFRQAPVANHPFP